MSIVELLDYNPIDNRRAGGLRFFFAISGFTVASTSGRPKHFSILVYDKEYEYGDCGIISSMEEGPRETLRGRITLGTTSKAQKEVEDFVTAMALGKFKDCDHDENSNNCVHFANELCKFLLNGQEISRSYLETIKENRFVKFFLKWAAKTALDRGLDILME